MDNAIVCYMYIDTGLCNFDHLSHDVPAQQKQEIVQSVPDSSPWEGVGSGNETTFKVIQSSQSRQEA